MLKSIGLSIIALVAACGLTFGQSRNWSLTDIERTVPYSVVLNSVPGLTSDEYATACVRLTLVLNGEMSPDKLFELSANEPLVIRASVAIVDALVAEYTKQLKAKQSTPTWIADSRCEGHAFAT